MYVAVIFKCAMARVIGVPVNKVQELTDGSAFCFTQTLPRHCLGKAATQWVQSKIKFSVECTVECREQRAESTEH